ncbi:MAG: hypothetical protein JWP87_976 [Labilithrix sp.]|nr:hypothetical protein [Labilithrix sp.]
MPRAAHLLSTAACLFALACGHEVSTPSAVRDAPVVTTTQVAVDVATPAPRGESCIEVDSELGGKHITLEGRIVVDESYEHPARGKTRPLILRLDAPRCAIGSDEPRIAEVHLAASDGLTLKPLVGKHVRVSGDPFTAHTAWHARPIVLLTTTATPLP